MALAGGEDVRQRGGVPAVGQEEVEEAGPGDLDAVEPIAQQCAELGADLTGHVARRRADDGARSIAAFVA